MPSYIALPLLPRWLCALLAALSSCASVDEAFTFGVVGDAPYAAGDEARFEAVIEGMNRSELAFVVHVGDVQGSPRMPGTALPPCTDESLESRLRMLQGSRHPLVLTPGDNDWTDCHLAGWDPLERLARVRALFFAGERSLGQRSMPMLVQARERGFELFVENRAWSQGGVEFATLHVVGSNDNVGRDAAMDAEAEERLGANLAWLAGTFERARAARARALVLFLQANPLFERDWPDSRVQRYLLGLPVPPPPSTPSGFDLFRAALRQEVEAFAGPVLLVHGDTHTFRLDKPLAHDDGTVLANFTRLETFGHPDVHWVRVEVDPRDPDVFSVRPVALRP